MVSVWLDTKVKGEKKYYIRSGPDMTPPRGEQHYKYLGQIHGDDKVIGYVTREKLTQLISKRQASLKKEYDGLEQMKSEI